MVKCCTGYVNIHIGLFFGLNGFCAGSCSFSSLFIWKSGSIYSNFLALHLILITTYWEGLKTIGVYVWMRCWCHYCSVIGQAGKGSVGTLVGFVPHDETGWKIRLFFPQNHKCAPESICWVEPVSPPHRPSQPCRVSLLLDRGHLLTTSKYYTC